MGYNGSVIAMKGMGMDRYRVIVTTVGTVVGVIMVLIFSFVAAESLIMKFFPQSSSANQQSTSSTVVTRQQESKSSGVNSTDAKQETIDDRHNTAVDTQQPEQSTGLQEPQESQESQLAATEAGQSGLLTTVVNSDLLTLAIDLMEQVAGPLLPIPVELDVTKLLELLESGPGGDNETLKSLLAPIL